MREPIRNPSARCSEEEPAEGADGARKCQRSLGGVSDVVAEQGEPMFSDLVLKPVDEEKGRKRAVHRVANLPRIAR